MARLREILARGGPDDMVTSDELVSISDLEEADLITDGLLLAIELRKDLLATEQPREYKA